MTETDRIKGLQPALVVYRRSDRGTETLADGDVARPGDLLRLGYTAAGTCATASSCRSTGAERSRFICLRTGRARLRSDAAAHVLLDQAYELDDAPSWERFYFVTGDTAFESRRSVEAARRAAARGLQSPPAALSIPGALTQSTFSLQKEARP